MTANPATAQVPVSATTTALPVDLRSVQDFSVLGGQAQFRQVMVLGDPAIALQTARVVPGIAQGGESALAVALVPGAGDLVDIKSLLLQILLELQRQSVAMGCAPQSSTDVQGV